MDAEIAKIRITVFGTPGVGKRSLIYSFLHATDNWIRESPEYLSYYDLPKDVFITSEQIKFCHIAVRSTKRASLMLRFSRPNLIILVTDSTLENVKTVANLIPQIYEMLPESRILIIANKQDLPSILSPEYIEKTLKVPVIKFIAIDMYDKIQRFALSEKIAELLGLTLGSLGKTGDWRGKKC